MPAATLTPTVTSPAPVFNSAEIVLKGQITVVAGTYSIGGLPFSFASLMGTQLTVGATASWIQIQSNVKTTANGGTPNTTQFFYSYAPGADATLGKVQVWTGAAAQAGLTELSNGANFPTDTIQYRAEFNRI